MSEGQPLARDYTDDLQGIDRIRGYQLLNMVMGLDFETDPNTPQGAEIWQERFDKPLRKAWRALKPVMKLKKVSTVNVLDDHGKGIGYLNAGADIDAAKLLRCLRNNPRPLLKPFLDTLLKWEIANPAQSSKPTYDEVFAVIAPEKARRLASNEGWNRCAARYYCKAKLPGARNKQIDAAYQSADGKFDVGRKSGNGAK